MILSLLRAPPHLRRVPEEATTLSLKERQRSRGTVPPVLWPDLDQLSYIHRPLHNLQPTPPLMPGPRSPPPGLALALPLRWWRPKKSVSHFFSCPARRKSDGEPTVSLAQSQTPNMPPCAAAALHLMPSPMMSPSTAANHLLPCVPVVKGDLRPHQNDPVLQLLEVKGTERLRLTDFSDFQPLESDGPVTAEVWDRLYELRSRPAWRDRRGLLGVYAVSLHFWKPLWVELKLCRKTWGTVPATYR